MRRLIAVLVAVAALAALVVIGVAVYNRFFGAPGALPPAATSPPAASPILSTPVAPPSPLLTAASPSPGPAADVVFTLAVTGISGSGFSRTVTARIGNDGTTDAHNTAATLEAFSQGTRVFLSGQESLRVDVGTVGAGQSVTKDVRMEFGLADGMRIMQSGVQFVITVRSDEKTEEFRYDYRP